MCGFLSAIVLNSQIFDIEQYFFYDLNSLITINTYVQKTQQIF